MKCKVYYWLYINGTTPTAKGPKKWEKELKSQNIDWKVKFNNIAKICLENRLREFNFKLLHRLTVTKKELCIYDVKSQTLSSILSLNATVLKPFMIKLLIGLMQNSIALFLQHLMKYYSEQILILYEIMSLNLITVYYLLSTTYTTRKFTIKLAILLNLC